MKPRPSYPCGVRCAVLNLALADIYYALRQRHSALLLLKEDGSGGCQATRELITEKQVKMDV